MAKAFGPFLLGCEVTCQANIYILIDVIHCVCCLIENPHLFTFKSGTVMSLLQDVLRHQTMDSIERRFDTTHPDSDNSDDELVNVVRRLVPYIMSRAEPLSRCPYRVRRHYPVQRPGQGRHHQGRPRNPTPVDYPVVEPLVIPSGCFLRISRRGYSDFWTFLTLPSVPRCARNGVEVNPSTMVTSALFLGVLSPIFG